MSLEISPQFPIESARPSSSVNDLLVPALNVAVEMNLPSYYVDRCVVDAKGRRGGTLTFQRRIPRLEHIISPPKFGIRMDRA
jgi:hypothetical protein